MLFIIDFDGTVAPTDTVDALLERFANAEWRRIESEWVAGRINSRQCMAAQLALVSADRAVLEEFLQSVTIDPSFAAFVQYVSPFADLAIVSDGLDYPIRHALQKLDIPPIPIYANRLEIAACGLGISFPYTEMDCAVQSGVCKCAVARSVDAGRGLTTVLVGDGRSDLCIARTAGYVFAKNSLRRFCEAEGIIHTPFESFRDVLAVITGWNIHERVRKVQEAAWPLV
jgi:2,3-diketo-5-methylthio-1-phosphopentane phosphatase